MPLENMGLGRTEVGDGEMYVADLMLTGLREWNEQLVQSLLIEETAQHVLSIPLSLRRVEDRFMWGSNRRAKYKVKYGYEQVQSMRGRQVFGPQDVVRRRIWSSGVPLNMQHFMWRAISDCLPIRVNLCMWKVPLESTICPVCQVEEKEVMHIMVRCGFFNNIRAGFGMGLGWEGESECLELGTFWEWWVLC